MEPVETKKMNHTKSELQITQHNEGCPVSKARPVHFSQPIINPKP